MTKIYAMTEKGEHIENEDRILINDTIVSTGTFEAECDGKLKICVADGVGGNNAGTVASSFVCENLKNIVPSGKTPIVVLGPLISKFCKDDLILSSTFLLSLFSISSNGSGVKTCL